MSTPADDTEERYSAPHEHSQASVRTGKGANGETAEVQTQQVLRRCRRPVLSAVTHSTRLPQESFIILQSLSWIPPLFREDNLITVHTQKATSPKMCILSVRLYLEARKFNKGGWSGDRAGPTWLTSISFLTNSQPDFGLTLNVYRINALGFWEW